LAKSDNSPIVGKDGTEGQQSSPRVGATAVAEAGRGAFIGDWSHCCRLFEIV